MNPLPLCATLALATTLGCGAAEPPAAPLPEGWTALRAMPVGVGEAAVAESGGKLYVVGGFDTRQTVQVYDLATDTWTLGPLLPRGTDNAAAVALPGALHVFGGEASPAVQVLDLGTGTWRAGPATPGPSFASAVALHDGKVHLVGGWSHSRTSNVSLTAHEVFDPAAGAFVAGGAAAAPTARNHAAAGVIGGRLVVTGGRGPGHEGSDAVNLPATELFDPATGVWSVSAPLPTPRSGGASAVLGGRLYVLGGGLPGDTVHATVERFDPASGTWERLPDMPAPATGHRAVAVGDSLYVVGGFATRGGARAGNGGVATAYRYRPPP
jgi:N-acetylneuraminic acid mutarotase